MTVLGRVGRTPAVALWVDPKVHAAEVARFRSKIVAGPGDADCSIWIGSIGADGYGQPYIARQGRGICVRPNRYALARWTGQPLEAAVLALHECDVPLCVKVANLAARRLHVVAGTQRDNMIRMAYTGRGGGRPVVRRDGLRARRARSVALREAVRDGWDSAAVGAALEIRVRAESRWHHRGYARSSV